MPSSQIWIFCPPDSDQIVLGEQRAAKAAFVQLHFTADAATAERWAKLLTAGQLPDTDDTQ